MIESKEEKTLNDYAEQMRLIDNKKYELLIKARIALQEHRTKIYFKKSDKFFLI